MELVFALVIGYIFYRAWVWINEKDKDDMWDL